MGITLLAGRDFTDADTKDAQNITIIDEGLARQYWPQPESARKARSFWTTGRQRAMAHDCWCRERCQAPGVQEETRASVYLPHQKFGLAGMTVVARTSADHYFIGALRREVNQVDPDLPVSEVATMEEVVAEAIWQPRLYAKLFAVFAGGAVLLALIGIYGVMAFLVQTRTHEIGVRMALGASARDVSS